MFHVKKEGSKQKYWWVISGILLQDKYKKCNFIGEDCKSKCAKTWKLLQNFESVTTSTFERKFVRRIGCIVKTRYCISSVGLMHYKHDETIRYRKWPLPFSRFVYKLCNNPWHKKLCFLCPFILTRKKNVLILNLVSFEQRFPMCLANKTMEKLRCKYSRRVAQRDRWVVTFYQNFSIWPKYLAQQLIVLLEKQQWMSVIAKIMLLTIGIA